MATRCAPVRCAHPSFWANCHAKRGAPRPPAHHSFAASYSSAKKFKFTISRNFLQARARTAVRVEYLSTGPPILWNITFPTLLSYAAPYWAMLHPLGLRCTLLSYTAPYWVASYWGKLHPSEQRCTLLSYAAPYWATLHPPELCSTLLSYGAPYLSYAAS